MVQTPSDHGKIAWFSRSLSDPASDCTVTCILVSGYLINAYLVYA